MLLSISQCYLLLLILKTVYSEHEHIGRQVIRHSDVCFLSERIYRNFDQMKEFCKTVNGSMVTVHSEFDNSILRQAFAADLTLLGAKRVENSFQWVDGKPHSFDSWKHGEPSNTNNEENCIEFFNGGLHDGQWNDVTCNTRAYTVCRLNDCKSYSELLPQNVKSIDIEHKVQELRSLVFNELLIAFENRLNERIDQIYIKLKSLLEGRKNSDED
ncbi:mannose-binding protein C-like isoform X2 [Leptotrombidium deliense]|uniref:Mannose-binding protein C-like isoform X2 n=1 Tax=Leptotrombidium deliense TaxID=299467 RepID=A0A443S292_9ACAR|nr:mannose-binding protein C-like isoform X2 [Leptotrombidium deliense]